MKKTISHYDEDAIKSLLLHRKVVRVDDDTMVLDNDTVLRVLPNEGCGGCNSGWYHLESLNTCNNAIMNVEFDCEDTSDDYEPDRSYRVFVCADGIPAKQTLLCVEGNDGNGYYGTGYELEVIVKGDAS